MEDPVYRVEYAKSGRSACKGRIPCKGTLIGKGELRFGSLTDFNGNLGFSWRHWGCVTSRQFTNICGAYSSAETIDGFETLRPEDQTRVSLAFQYRSVDPNDIPDTALMGKQTVQAAGQDAKYAAINAASSPSKAAVDHDPIDSPSKSVYSESSSPVKREDIKPKPKRAPAKSRAKKVKNEEDSVKAELEYLVGGMADPFAANVDPSPTNQVSGRRSTRLVARALARADAGQDVKPVLFDQSSEPEDEDIKPVVKKAAPKGKGKGKPKPKKVVSEDEEFQGAHSD